jgi:hypothetical protein
VRRLLPAVLLTVAVACGGSPGAEPTTVSEAITTTAAAATTTTTTTVAATTTTEAPGLEGEALLACMVGSWGFDTEGFEIELQAHSDPDADSIIIEVVSGGGNLDIRADSTFSLSYGDLTIRENYPVSRSTGPGLLEYEVVVSGEVAAAFELDGNAFLPDEVDDPVLEIRSGEVGGALRELPPSFRYASLRMGTRANNPYHLEKITIDCDEDQLVVNDEVRVDELTGDGPSTIWLRNGEG